MSVAAAKDYEVIQLQDGEKGKKTIVNTENKTTSEQTDKNPLEHHFYLEARSIVDNKMYAGDFTVTKVSIGGIGRIGVLRAQLNSGLFVDITTDNLHYMISHCQVSCTRYPDWFKDPSKLNDIYILEKVFEEVRKFEESFRKVGGE